jgi:hypothetical protein
MLSGRQWRKKRGGNDVVSTPGRSIQQWCRRRSCYKAIVKDRGLTVHLHDEGFDAESVKDQTVEIVSRARKI